MNKLILGVATLIIGSGLFVFLGDSGDSENPAVEKVDSAVGQTSVQSAQGSDEVLIAGYVDYSVEAIAENSDTSRVVFFHADWCSTCNFYERQIKEVGVPEGITVLKADFDRDTELKKKYGVRVQSTFVLLDENGEVARTWPFAAGLNGIQDLYDAVI